MTAIALPDRERRHLLQFHLFPAMGYGLRMALAFGLIGVALLVQPAFNPMTQLEAWALTLIPLFAGNLLLLVRGFDLKPSCLKGDRRWERATAEQFRRITDLVRSIRRWDETITDISCASGFFMLLLLALACGGIVFVLGQNRSTEPWAVAFAIDAAVLILPHWLTGMRRGWRPVALEQEVAAIQTALNAAGKMMKPACQIQRMFEMAGVGDDRVPDGARAFISFPDGPEDFLGIQFQVSLNNVQGTKYPYLYAVLVARHGLGLLKSGLSADLRAASPLTIETKRESDVEVIVIRQKTTKNSGYHTKPRNIEEIVAAACLAAEAIVKGNI